MSGFCYLFYVLLLMVIICFFFIVCAFFRFNGFFFVVSVKKICFEREWGTVMVVKFSNVFAFYVW